MRDVIVLWGSWNRLSQNEWIKTREMDSVEVLELKSRIKAVARNMVPPKALGEGPSLPLS